MFDLKNDKINFHISDCMSQKKKLYFTLNVLQP